MIGFMPSKAYKDELVYSWFARYYAHSGHPAYVFAIEDLLEGKNTRPDVEFINRLNPNAREIITKMIPMEELILKHTMFPYYRFIENTRLHNALKSMAGPGEDAHCLLPVPKNRTSGQAHYIRYCPLCAAEEREAYGEACFTRSANIRNVDICAKHKCKLKNTNIERPGKQSARLYVAEVEIKDVEPEFVDDGLELQFAQYMTNVFQRPIEMDNTIGIGEFLNSKLENTKYLSTRGKKRNVTLLFNDFIEFYKELPNQGITKLSQMQKIFTGYRWDFYEICQMAFFLKINIDELVNPRLPDVSQTEIFNEKVARLYDAGLGCHKIAREMGCSPSTAKNANRISPRAEHDYSGRKGIKRNDWEKMDEDMLQQVRETCEHIYHNNGNRPGHVTVNAVCRALKVPGKRFDYLPKCRKMIHGYEEINDIYWAREVVWCYQDLIKKKEEDEVCWRDIRNITNLRKNNFIASFPYLYLFTDENTENKIKNLLPV